MEANLTNIISVAILELILCIGFIHIFGKACDEAIENVKQMAKDFDNYKNNKGEIK